MTGLFALSEGMNKLWLGVSYADNIKVRSFNPFNRSQVDRWEASPAIAGVQRFILWRDRIFYTTDGSSVQSQVFNPTATEKAQPTDITTLKNPADTALDFSNNRLHDFRHWAEWVYDPPSGSSEGL